MPYGEGPKPELQRLLILSAPTVGHGAPPFGSVGRLLQVDAAHPTLTPIVSRLVTAVGPGTPVRLGMLPTERLDPKDRKADSLGVLEGPDAEAVLRKLLVLGREVSNLPRPLVCRVFNGRSALSMPSSYPAPPAGVDAQQWFLDMAQWWQAADAGSTGRWNHGERIRSGVGGDQVKAAVAALAAKPASSRAVVVLTRADSDLAVEAEFPAFVSAQFLLSEGTLDVVAQFRKQEMPHWWPVNVAELALLQQDVIDRLGAVDVEAEAGSITTVTAIPVAGGPLPRVAVPYLDRLVDDPGGVLPLLLPLLLPAAITPEAATRAQEQWNRALGDWTPSRLGPAADGDPVPVAGFEVVRTAADHLLDGIGNRRDAGHEQFLDLLRMLGDANRKYATSRSDADRGARHDAWRNEVLPLVERLRGLLSGRLAAVAEPEGN